MHGCTICLRSWAYLIMSFMNTFTNYKKIELKQLKKNTIRTAIVESSTCFNAYAS